MNWHVSGALLFSDINRKLASATTSGLRFGDNLLLADDSGAVPLNPLKMSLYRRFPPLLLRAEDLA